MPINPNIALGVQPLQLADPMAQYGKVMAIQGAQQQNRLADMQMAEYERARTEEQGLRNYLAKADFTKPETRTGLYQFGKTGRDYVKTLAEQEAAAATLAETKSKTNERDYKLRVEKANKAISDIAALNTPEEAIASIDAHLKNGDIDENKANMLKGRLAAAPSFGAWQKDMLVNILDAKEKLTMTMPKVARQDVGGQIITIQDNPMLPGYGLPVQSMAPIKKTATIGERTAQGQLSLAQQRFMWEKANPGFELKEDADGNFYGINKRTLQATPVMVGGTAPMATPAAPSAGMLGPRVPAPATQAIPGMPSVLDRPAAAPAVATPSAAPTAGAQLRGKKDIPAKFADTDMQLSGLAGSLKEFKNEVGKQLATGAKFLPTGADTARMQAKYTALLMGVKDLYTLGALAGPDMSIIESQLTNPASWSGKLTSQKGFEEQVEVIENMLKRTADNLEKTYGRPPKATKEALKSLESGLTGASANDPLGLGTGGR